MTSLSAVDPTLATVTAPPRTKRLLLAATGLAALVAAGLYAAHWWTSARFVETTDDAYIGGDITVIGPKVAGHIEQVLVSDNQQVKAGDLLMSIDRERFQAAFEQRPFFAVEQCKAAARRFTFCFKCSSNWPRTPVKAAGWSRASSNRASSCNSTARSTRRTCAANWPTHSCAA